MTVPAAVVATGFVMVISAIAILMAHVASSDTEDPEWEAYRCEFE